MAFSPNSINDIAVVPALVFSTINSTGYSYHAMSSLLGGSWSILRVGIMGDASATEVVRAACVL